MRLLVRHSPAELMYCLQTQTPRAICTRWAIDFEGWLAVNVLYFEDIQGTFCGMPVAIEALV